MEWVAIDRLEVTSVATPELFSLTVPKVELPSLKVTLPVGVVPRALVTVALKVTDRPLIDGLAGVAVRTVVVALVLAATIVMVSALLAVLPPAVTLNVGVKVPVADGVPEMMPVDELRFNPAGRDPA